MPYKEIGIVQDNIVYSQCKKNNSFAKSTIHFPLVHISYNVVQIEFFFFVKTIATKNIFLHLYLQYHFDTSNCIFKKQNFVVVVLMLGEIPPLSLKYYLL